MINKKFYNLTIFIITIFSLIGCEQENPFEDTVIVVDTTIVELEKTMHEYEELLKVGKQVAFVIKKDALTYDGEIQYKNDYGMLREEIIEHIVNVTGEDPIISTTGKTSRELFEIREKTINLTNMTF